MTAAHKKRAAEEDSCHRLCLGHAHANDDEENTFRAAVCGSAFASHLCAARTADGLLSVFVSMCRVELVILGWSASRHRLNSGRVNMRKGSERKCDSI